MSPATSASARSVLSMWGRRHSERQKSAPPRARLPDYLGLLQRSERRLRKALDQVHFVPSRTHVAGKKRSWVPEEILSCVRCRSSNGESRWKRGSTQIPSLKVKTVPIIGTQHPLSLYHAFAGGVRSTIYSTNALAELSRELRLSAVPDLYSVIAQSAAAKSALFADFLHAPMLYSPLAIVGLASVAPGWGAQAVLSAIAGSPAAPHVCTGFARSRY